MKHQRIFGTNDGLYVTNIANMFILHHRSIKIFQIRIVWTIDVKNWLNGTVPTA